MSSTKSALKSLGQKSFGRANPSFTISIPTPYMPQRSGIREARRTYVMQSTAKWWSQTGSNRRPHACKARALPTELWPQTSQAITADQAQRMVGPGGLEPPTSRLSGVCSNQLSYRPKALRHNRIIRPIDLHDLTADDERKEKRRRRRTACIFADPPINSS